MDKDITVPTQQQATSTVPQELAATQFTDEGEIAYVRSIGIVKVTVVQTNWRIWVMGFKVLFG